jgi:GxxExxY protein
MAGGTNLESLVTNVIDCGLRIHRHLGPGLLESVYERLLADGLEQQGILVVRQHPVDFCFEGKQFVDGFRADLFVENQLVIEIKSVERLAPVHSRQLLTYLRLMEQPLGLLLNFGGATFKEGIKRVVNNYAP